MRDQLASVCMEHDIGMLPYGTLLGGYPSKKQPGEK